MGFLHFLESIRIPGLNELMMGITYLGDQVVFLIVALSIFWCISKQTGYFVMTVGFIGAAANQFMKLFFRVPRPWVLDPDFTIVEAARSSAGGYSFPSGHSQSAVGTYGALALVTENRRLRWLFISIAVLVPFSRMYLGVHTPYDVLVGAGMAGVLIFLMRPVNACTSRSKMIFLFCVMNLIAAAYLLFTQLYPFPPDVDPANLESGITTAYTLMGAIVGMLLVYVIDSCWLHFPVDAVWWAQLLKMGLGLIVVLVVKSLLKVPLNLLLGDEWGRSVRYFFVVLTAGTLWPMTFRFFSRLGDASHGQSKE